MKICVLSLMGLILCSCATLTYKKTYDMKVSSAISNAKISIYDSIYDLPASVRVKRTKEILPLTLISDSGSIDYRLKPALSPAFFGNVYGIYVSPLAFVIDLTNQKRFYYGYTLLLDPKDSMTTIRPSYVYKWRNFWQKYFLKDFPKNKGQIDASFSIPSLNSFRFKPQREGIKSRTGSLGLSLGLDYYYKRNRFINVSIQNTLDFIYTESFEYIENMSTLYGSFTHNHSVGRFNIGYGINFSRNTWELQYEGGQIPSGGRQPVRKTNQTFGVSFSTHYKLGRRIFAGLVYRPTFFQIKPVAKLTYEHLLSFEVGYKLRLKQ